MTIKIGIVMDPIKDIKIHKDSSFAMLLEAQSRGWELYYLEMQDLSLENGRCFASSKKLTVQRDPNNFYQLEDAIDHPLSDLDAVLMRKDPPFDTEYIYATYLLERAEQEGCLIVNKPQSLRDANEKLFTAWFSEFTPTTLVTRNSLKIREFHKKHKDVILKPLDGMGGASIFRIKEDDVNVGVIIETLTEHQTRYCMAQVFMPEITAGDKRILIIDGEPMPYALARIPALGETRGNLAAGGRGVAQPLSESDWHIANTIGPKLKEKGLIFVGLDVIGNKITEINVTSPTCIQEIDNAYGTNISAKLMDAIEKRITKKQ
ncbi:glutathione synthase [Psychromonas ingrahamii 37]|uniref:Glutathione synthetase n=1 Tax=Psychromonas ingrahamii (strain DSM 17664 / CCUG 51855 / 37) TaxID=357804 RepID=A1SUE9_PSYIN|nr:glutathione synthase [Psychromonas ingrahamii]ABM03114.1 glutathione synthase [Psychromonas ingrahamii 37]